MDPASAGSSAPPPAGLAGVHLAKTAPDLEDLCSVCLHCLAAQGQAALSGSYPPLSYLALLPASSSFSSLCIMEDPR